MRLYIKEKHQLLPRENKKKGKRRQKIKQFPQPTALCRAPCPKAFDWKSLTFVRLVEDAPRNRTLLVQTAAHLDSLFNLVGQTKCQV